MSQMLGAQWSLMGGVIDWSIESEYNKSNGAANKDENDKMGQHAQKRPVTGNDA